MSENPIEGRIVFSVASEDVDFAWQTLWEVAQQAAEHGMTIEELALTKYPGAKIDEIHTTTLDELRERFGTR